MFLFDEWCGIFGVNVDFFLVLYFVWFELDNEVESVLCIGLFISLLCMFVGGVYMLYMLWFSDVFFYKWCSFWLCMYLFFVVLVLVGWWFVVFGGEVEGLDLLCSL